MVLLSNKTLWYMSSLVIALSTLISCAAPDPAVDAEADVAAPAESEIGSVLTPDGWGPLRIGMSRAEVVAAAGEDAHPELVGGPEPEACDQFRPARAPEDLLVMIERDRLTRISIFGESELKTVSGFGIGDQAEEIRAAYGGRAEVTPHKYVAAPAEYITIWRDGATGDKARGIVYEIGEDGRVTHVHAGGPSIQYVEGCL